MASTGKKGKKNKGKTVPLNDFLSSKTISWSDQVDEADKLGEFNRKPVLPAAPRAARALEIDESKIPKSPPYVAYVSNLSYELQDGDILNAFVGLNVANVRLPRDERSGRLKGFGYVEFGDRESFISALLKYEATIRGRRIKIDVAENEGERRRGGPKDNRDRDTPYESEKTLGDWRSGPRSEFSGNEDRRGPQSGRKDYGGFRDGYDKGRGGESSWRDGERRYGNDKEGRGYGNRRNYEDSENQAEPKTRTKLNLCPRTLPIEENIVKEEVCSKKDEDRTEQEKPSAASIFGQAKPVDTSAREREIEQRLEKEKEGVKSEKDLEKSKPKNSVEDPNTETKRTGPPESKENVWVRRALRLDSTQNVTSRESSGKPDSLDEPPHKESEKKNSDNIEESSRFSSNKRSEEYESDRDNDSRYGRFSKNESRYNDRNRDGEKSYRRDDRWRDDKDRRDRRDHDRRDRGYDSDRRSGNNVGRLRDQDKDGDSRRFDKDGEARRYNDREGDSRRYNDRENDWRKSNEKDGDNKRLQDRDGGRYRDQDDYGSSRGPRGDKRGGLATADKGSRQLKINQDREKGPQNKDRSRDQKKPDDGLRMPKLKEAAAPNYIGTNKYSYLEEDAISE